MHQYTYEGNINLKLWSWIISISGGLSFILNWISSFIKSSLDINISFIALSTGALSIILYKVFSKCLWNKKYIKMIIGYPDLNGKWSIEGKSENLEKNKVYDWEGTLNIVQSYNEILITLSTKTSSSSSKSNSCSIKKLDGQGYVVEYTYDNNPNHSADNDMKKHEGKATLIFDFNGFTGQGNYFNNNRDRATNGTMKLLKEMN